MKIFYASSSASSNHPKLTAAKVNNPYVIHLGKKYEYQGTYTETLTREQAILYVAVSALQCFFTLGIFVTFQELKENFYEALVLKRTVKVFYLSKDQTSTTDQTNTTNKTNGFWKRNKTPVSNDADLLTPEQIEARKGIEKGLDKVVDFLKANNREKKLALVELAYESFKKNQFKVNVQEFRLKNPEDYNPLTKTPDYLFDEFANNPLKLEMSSGFYDYPLRSRDNTIFHIIFGNAHIGGGVLRGGLAQEELFVLKSPELLAKIGDHLILDNGHNHGKCSILVRGSSDQVNQPDKDAVLRASPNPYLLMNLHLVQVIGTAENYSKLSSMSADQLAEQAQEMPNPAEVNGLFVSVPWLKEPNLQEKQINEDTLLDVFNTIYSGFQLALEHSKGKCVIYSGKLGCGVFKHDAEVVFLLQCLAAQQLGIELKLFDFRNDIKKNEQKEYLDTWKSLVPKFKGCSLIECLQIINAAMRTKKLGPLLFVDDIESP